MSDTTWSEAAAQMIAVVGRLAALEGELNAWAAGAVAGGPNGDGRYPFTQPDGFVALIPCPAKLATLTELSQKDRDLLMLSDATSRAGMVEAERKAQAFYGSAPPTLPRYGDLWIDPSAGPMLRWYNGTGWSNGPGGGSGGGGAGGTLANAIKTLQDGPLIGGPGYAWQPVVTYDIEIPLPGVAVFTVNLVQSYSAPGILPCLWGTRITVGGESVKDMNGGTFGSEVPSASINKAIPEGRHTIGLEWRGQKSGLRLVSASLSTLVLPMPGA